MHQQHWFGLQAANTAPRYPTAYEPGIAAYRRSAPASSARTRLTIRTSSASMLRRQHWRALTSRGLGPLALSAWQCPSTVARQL